jgi:hypothetical protein
MVLRPRATVVIPSSLRPSPDTVSTRVGDEVVLVHLKTERMHVLNRTGARLWELLCAGRDWAEIRGVILAEFDVTPGQLDTEMEDLIRSLREEQLVSLDRERPE